MLKRTLLSLAASAAVAFAFGVLQPVVRTSGLLTVNTTIDAACVITVDADWHGAPGGPNGHVWLTVEGDTNYGRTFFGACFQLERGGSCTASYQLNPDTASHSITGAAQLRGHGGRTLADEGSVVVANCRQ